MTPPSRTVSDLLHDREEPEAVAHVVADALRGGQDQPGAVADALAPHAAQLGLRRGDGLGLLGWLLDLAGDRDTRRWMEEAREHVADAATRIRPAPAQAGAGASPGR